MKLNEAISKRLAELLQQRDMTSYQLYKQSGTYKSTIGNVLHCKYDSVKIRIIHEICQGLNITLKEFFDSDLFDEEKLEP